MNLDRSWMYRRYENGLFTPSFIKGVDQFVQYATSQPRSMDGTKIKCPCNLVKCQNRQFLEPDTVKSHLQRNGFVPNYYVWTYQGETNLSSADNRNIEAGGPSFVGPSDDDAFEDPTTNTYSDMIHDAAGPEFNLEENVEEPPNADAKLFYDMLAASEQELWPGCEKHSELSLIARLVALKSNHRLSERCFDEITELMKEIVPEPNRIPANFYRSKKLMRGMGLPVEKIDCCKNGCMIYWGEDVQLSACKICGHARFKTTRKGGSKRQKTSIPYKRMFYFPLTPRLKRLYASNATASKMRWHADHKPDEGKMHHPSDSPAWKHFNDTHPTFAAESRNVRLGLCTDGFQPFGQSGKQFSSWPVIVTPYNLPPGVCMKAEHMFLTVLVPGPDNPKNQLDVYLQPLIAELKQLWEVGVNSYDISKKQNFQLRAALMWTISDFPAYSMLSGWGTAGRLACPHCMNETDAFTLKCSHKQSWFDNHRKFLPPDHVYRRNRVNFRKGKTVTKDPPPIRTGTDILRELDRLGLKKVTEIGAAAVNKTIRKKTGCGWKKRSIFWDLPYWSSLLIRHNLDVMHTEKNVFENVIHTIMNVVGKTKDHPNSREELNDYCRRPELQRDSTTGKYPKACYTLDKEARAKLCDWVKELKFPDGYASNLGRCLEMKKLRLYGMKSHDCHIFMQRLIPIAFRELLPQHVWKALTELSLFFKDLTATVIGATDMTRLGKDIAVILCKLERIFPPSFFDSMEHLPVHLPYEASIAGPVHYRWMYPFERYNFC